MTPEQIERYVTDMLGGLGPVVRVEEACALLGCGRRELYRRVSSGEIPAARAKSTGSSRLLIPRAGMGDYLRKRLGAG